MFKALVIDDEKAFTEIAVRFLTGFCQVTVAATAENGLDAAKTFQPDILVVDNQLPGLSGVDVVKRIRAERGRDVYIVMITIDKEDEIAAALQPEVADRFLKKPFRRSDLEGVLLEAIVAVKKKKGSGQ